jgi:hypothetical protein
MLRQITFGELVKRYRDTVSVKKRASENERISLNTLLAHRICARRLSEVRTEDFAEFRDDRLKTIKPVSLKLQLDPVHHMFEVAKREWGIPIRENPITKLKLEIPVQKRERRLQPGELERLLQAAQSCRNKTRMGRLSDDLKTRHAGFVRNTGTDAGLSLLGHVVRAGPWPGTAPVSPFCP